MFESFEEALYSYLLSCENITSLLTRWQLSDQDNKSIPAIFNINYPPDNAEGWKHKIQYPRIVFYTQWANDTDQIEAGSLILYIHSLDNLEIQPENIEKEINNSLSDVFFNTLRGVFCCTWISSEPFMIDGENEPVQNGIRLEYQVRAFPDQYTYLNPDPIPAIEDYIKSIDNDLLIINRDELPEIFVPEYPVIYVRSLDVGNLGKDTYKWRIMQLHGAIHVISTNPKITRQVLGKIEQQAMIDGEINLLDGGQFLITDDRTNLQIMYGHSKLLDGQYELTGEFGINAVNRSEERIKNIEVTGRYE